MLKEVCSIKIVFLNMEEMVSSSSFYRNPNIHFSPALEEEVGLG